LNFIATEEDQARIVGVVRFWRVCFAEILSETTDRLENSFSIDGLMLISKSLNICWPAKHNASSLLYPKHRVHENSAVFWHVTPSSLVEVYYDYV
jgi:hypothetical protein